MSTLRIKSLVSSNWQDAHWIPRKITIFWTQIVHSAVHKALLELCVCRIKYAVGTSPQCSWHCKDPKTANSKTQTKFPSVLNEWTGCFAFLEIMFRFQQNLKIKINPTESLRPDLTFRWDQFLFVLMKAWQCLNLSPLFHFNLQVCPNPWLHTANAKL
jgi:hypothetical protein